MYNMCRLQNENKYSRSTAVNYALTYGLNFNPNYRYFNLINNNGGDCTNFTSQCLFAGGAPMEFNSSRPWWYKHGSAVSQDAWSLCWSIAHSLYYYLRVNAEKNSPFTKGIEVASAEQLEPGDLIFLQREKGHIYHSCIVTASFLENILVTQHTYEAVNIPYQKPAAGIIYHYVKIVI